LLWVDQHVKARFHTTEQAVAESAA